MSESPLERAVEALKAEPGASPGFSERTLAGIRRDTADRRRRARWTGFGLAALVVVALGALLSHGQRPGPIAVHFTLTAPGASTVTLVGDFNDWNRQEAVLTRATPGGAWTITLPLPAGLYRYAFLVDGTRWVADSTRAIVADPDYGTPLSVMPVGAPRL